MRLFKTVIMLTLLYCSETPGWLPAELHHEVCKDQLRSDKLRSEAGLEGVEMMLTRGRPK